MKSLLTGLLLIAVAPLLRAADTTTRIFDTAFRTLKVEVPGAFMAPPEIGLDDPSQLCVSFDEMGDERSYLRYRLVHCNADWQPSSLMDSEVLPSFNEAEVSDFAFSSGVFRRYVNYRVCLPNDDMRPLVSGNYLLQVYREDDPDTVVLQARFTVCEDTVRLTGSASSVTDRGSAGEYQQLSLEINTGSYRIDNPHEDLIITVEQNGLDVTPQAPVRPLRTEPGKLIYEHNAGLIFPAGNEFRRFETVRTDYAGMHVASNRYEGDGYTATLEKDSERATRPYSFDRTQAGRFKVDDYDSTDPDLGADYVQTIFTLDFPQVTNGEILLDGEFARPLSDEERRMNYDPATGLYSASLPLKQGSYNYRYVARSNTPGARPDLALVEGNHFQTANEYVVRVYHRAPGSRYDRLIGSVVIMNTP